MSEEKRIDIRAKKRYLQNDINKVVNGFKTANKDCITNKEIRRMLVEVALGFELEDPRLEECVVGSKEWEEARKEEEKKKKERQEPVMEHLGELYNILCHQVKNFLIEHPDMIKTLLQCRKEQSSRIGYSIKPMVSFHFGIDDIFELLKFSGTSDVGCGFHVGNDDISIC
ncbi:MAG: hypothetical protein K2M17_03715 [Bacilli bacterium]|nr:hypothetical protein [Bacilli bacterium]